MKYAVTFGQKYNNEPHKTLGDEVAGNSYMLVYADDELIARSALHKLLPLDEHTSDYAFIYEFDEDFERQIREYDLKPLSVQVNATSVYPDQWHFQSRPEHGVHASS